MTSEPIFAETNVIAGLNFKTQVYLFSLNHKSIALENVSYKMRHFTSDIAQKVL